MNETIKFAAYYTYVKESSMRKFFYKCVNGLAVLYLGFFLVLSYCLVYNEYYVEFHPEIEVSYEDGELVYPLGEIVGIYTEGSGVFVIDTCEIESMDGKFVSPAGGVLRTGDYIIEVNGVELVEKETLVKAVNACDGKEIKLTIMRGKEKISTSVMPVMGKNGKYLLGVWVKDDLAGVGTITYYTESGLFAALGHGMSNGVNKDIFSVRGGDIYFADIVGIRKGKRGQPGEVKGVIYYGVGHHLGELDTNCGEGIYGALDKEDVERYKINCEAYKIGRKEELQVGPAQIISDISGKRKTYDIEIVYVDYLAVSSKKGLHIEVTDPELLELTGGIVQGMSGSPIIQNGKLVGAVTHVLINEPTKGYGIFIEEMMEK